MMSPQLDKQFFSACRKCLQNSWLQQATKAVVWLMEIWKGFVPVNNFNSVVIYLRAAQSTIFFKVVDPYLTDAPEEILASGEFTQVPTMLGATSGEGVLFLTVELLRPEERLEEINQDWTFWGPYYAFDVERSEEPTAEQAAIADAAKVFYFPNGEIVGPDNLPELVKFWTDTHFQ